MKTFKNRNNGKLSGRIRYISARAVMVVTSAASFFGLWALLCITIGALAKVTLALICMGWCLV